MPLAGSCRENAAIVELGGNATQTGDADGRDVINDREDVLGVAIGLGNDLASATDQPSD